MTFDPTSGLTFEQLLRKFWSEHQPMPMAFTGSQYRSAIFYHTEAQRDAAARVRASLAGDSPFSSPLEQTALEEASPFYRAEEYHQRWLEKQRRGSLWAPSI